MSDDAVSQPEDNASRPEENVSRAEFEALQDQLKEARAERDREAREKAEIVAKANVFSGERDAAKQELAEVLADRDKTIGDIVADHDKALADMASVRDQLARDKARLETSLAEATGRAGAAEAEIAKLRATLGTLQSQDPLVVLSALVGEKTKAAIAWTRAKIPADSPALPWFDKTVETVGALGCAAVKLTKEFIVWATPRVIELSKKGAAKVEEMLAKK
jgi:chromosome segregation ATPase